MTAYELGQFLDFILRLLSFAIIGRALMSWFDPHYNNPFSRLLFSVTEPILKPIRSIMPGGMMIDFSPMIAIMIIWVLQSAL